MRDKTCQLFKMQIANTIQASVGASFDTMAGKRKADDEWETPPAVVTRMGGLVSSTSSSPPLSEYNGTIRFLHRSTETRDVYVISMNMQGILLLHKRVFWCCQFTEQNLYTLFVDSLLPESAKKVTGMPIKRIGKDDIDLVSDECGVHNMVAVRIGLQFVHLIDLIQSACAGTVGIIASKITNEIIPDIMGSKIVDEDTIVYLTPHMLAFNRQTAVVACLASADAIPHISLIHVRYSAEHKKGELLSKCTTTRKVLASTNTYGYVLNPTENRVIDMKCTPTRRCFVLLDTCILMFQLWEEEWIDNQYTVFTHILELPEYDWIKTRIVLKDPWLEWERHMRGTSVDALARGIEAMSANPSSIRRQCPICPPYVEKKIQPVEVSPDEYMGICVNSDGLVVHTPFTMFMKSVAPDSRTEKWIQLGDVLSGRVTNAYLMATLVLPECVMGVQTMRTETSESTESQLGIGSTAYTNTIPLPGVGTPRIFLPNKGGHVVFCPSTCRVYISDLSTLCVCVQLEEKDGGEAEECVGDETTM